MKSRESVLKNEMFEKIFGEYANAIGIKAEPVEKPQSWIELESLIETYKAKKAAEEEKRK